MSDGHDGGTDTEGSALRRRAEEQLAAHEAVPQRTGLYGEEALRWIHELEVHQVELELQNAELLETRARLEAALDRATDLYEFAPAGYLTLDRTGGIVEANLTAARLLLVDRGRLIGARFALYLAPDERAAFAELLSAALEGGGQTASQAVLADEGVRPMGESPRVLRIELAASSGARECRVQIVDVTAASSAERRLRESEERYRALVEGTADVVAQLDRAGRIHFVNHACRAVLGREPLACLGTDALGYVHPEDRERSAQWFAESAHDASARATLENRVVAATGEVREVEWVAAFHGDGGAGHCVSLIGRDVTDARRREAERRELETSEALVTLAGGLAHELNNALTAIMGYAELALSDIAAPRQAESPVTQVLVGGKRAAKLVALLGDYCMLPAPADTRVSLSAVVADAVRLVRPELPECREVSLELAEGLPLIDGHERRLRQVATSLILNASESYGDKPGSIAVRTGIRDYDAEWLHHALPKGVRLTPGPFVFLQVSDMGCGMDEAVLARAFDPFFSTKFPGRGLGLPAAVGIARRHRGAIHVVSTPGEGTAATVVFPPMPNP